MQSDDVKPDIGRRIAGALAWSSIGTWGQFAITAGALVIMARLLGPGPFGVNAAAWIVIGFGQAVVAGALAQVLVQRQTVEPGHFDATLWANLALGIGLAAAILATRTTISQALSIPAASDVISISVFVLPIVAAQGVPEAILLRNLRFREVAIINNIAAALGNLTGIILAVLGFGVWSLVSIALITALVKLAGAAIATRWTPGISCRKRHFTDLGKFNTFVIGARLLTVGERAIPRILISSLFGETTLGLYTLGWRLFETLATTILDPIIQIVLPTVSRARERSGDLVRLFRNAIALATTIAFPVYGGLAAVAAVAVPVLFGESWGPAAPVVSVLACFGAVRALSAIQGDSLRGFGKPFEAFAVVGTGFAITLILAPLGSSLGSVGIAGALVASGLLVWPLGAHFVARTGGIPVRDQIAPALPALAAAAVMVAAVTGVIAFTRDAMGEPALLALAIGVGIAVYALALAVVARPIVRFAISLAAAVLRRDRAALGRLFGEVGG